MTLNIKTDSGMQYLVHNSSSNLKFSHAVPSKEILRITPDGIILIKTGWLQRKILAWLLSCEVRLLKD